MYKFNRSMMQDLFHVTCLNKLSGFLFLKLDDPGVQHGVITTKRSDAIPNVPSACHRRSVVYHHFIHIINIHLTCCFLYVDNNVFLFLSMCLISIGCGFWNDFSCWSIVLLRPDDEVRKQSFPHSCCRRRSRSLVMGGLASIISPKGGHCDQLMSAHFTPDSHCYSTGVLCSLCSFDALVLHK